MLISKEVEITIGSKNKKFYIDKGYNVKLGDSLIIPIEDLFEGSKVKVDVRCHNPDCSIEKDLMYRDYIKNINASGDNEYYCIKCSGTFKNKISAIKKQENNTIFIGDMHYWTFEENRKKEFLKYISEYEFLDNMKNINNSLYSAICRYEKRNYEFANKLNLNIEELFRYKKPNGYYNKEYIIKSIKKFINENSRFPSQQEMIPYAHCFNKYFKDYDSCKKEINYYNKDDLIDNRGDINRSYYELFTANFFSAQGLGDKYSREEHPFKEFDSKLGGYRSDFTLYTKDNNVIHVEVWADNEKIKETVGYFKDYLSVRKEKERLYDLYSDKICLISIEPSTFSGNLKSIYNKLYKIFKQYINLEFKTIDYELLLPFNSMSEEQTFLKLMTYTGDSMRLPYIEEIKSKNGGYRLLLDINRRFGGISYFSKKYNVKMSCKINYWNEEKVFEIYDYMIDTYGKFYSKEDNKKIKDDNLKGFYSYVEQNIGVINSKLKYCEYVLNKNTNLNGYLFEYINGVINNRVKRVTTITNDQQELAKKILNSITA